jgi:hypothetical protein
MCLLGTVLRFFGRPDPSIVTIQTASFRLLAHIKPKSGLLYKIYCRCHIPSWWNLAFLLADTLIDMIKLIWSFTAVSETSINFVSASSLIYQDTIVIHNE